MNQTNHTKKSILNTLVDGISSIFIPLINVITAAGILKGVLAILTACGVFSELSESYQILNTFASSMFYFLPIFLAYTSAKKFDADPYIAVVIACILLYPSLTSLLESGKTVYFLGLPIRGVNYQSSVIPILCAVGLQTYLERLCNKIFPQMVRGFLTSIVCILLIGSVTLIVLGPIGAVIGDALAVGYGYVYSLSPVAAGFLLGGTIQPMVIFGFSWSFLIIAMNNIAVTGQDSILALMGPAVFAQVGAALAVMLKAKDKNLKTLCVSASLSGIFGITEPAMYGVNLPRKKPMIAVCIGGAVGGALAGLSGAQAMTFALPSLVTWPIFFGNGFGLFCISNVVAMAVAFVCTMCFRFEVDLKTNDKTAATAENEKNDGNGDEGNNA